MVPGRGSPAPTPVARRWHGRVRTAASLAPSFPPDSPPLLLHNSCPGAANRGVIFLYCFGETFLLFILFLPCSGVSLFNNVLVLIHSSSHSLLRNDFYCCFFFLLLDRSSDHVSCAPFQLVFPSCISATKPIHPPSITAAAPLSPLTLRDARPKSAVE